MKKIKSIIYTLSLLFVLCLFGCKTEMIEISSKISSVSATDSSITFFETTFSNTPVTARAVLEKDSKEVDLIDSIVVGTTTEYSFTNLLAGTDYVILIQVKTDSNYITYAKEQVKTSDSITSDITIECADKEVVYDGKEKTLTATTSVEGLPLTYKYSLNGNPVDTVVDAGEYRVEISFAGNTLYNPCSITRTLKILKAEVVLECDNVETIYDGTKKEVSASSNISGLELSYVYLLNGQEVKEAKDAGEYTVVIEYSGNKNYSSCRIERKLTIKQKVVPIEISDFAVDYLEPYEISLNTSVSYTVSYCKDSILLEAKPTLPGTYNANIVITDSNYSGKKEIQFTIRKLKYTLSYEDLFVLEGTPVTFEVDEFVHVEYYLNNIKVNEIAALGDYIVKFSFENHLYYEDFSKSILVVVDNKKRITIDANPVITEAGMEYMPTYTTNYDVELDVSYYLGDEKIEKPSCAGIYTIKLAYNEDNTYHSVEKLVNLYIYPEEQAIRNLSNGLYHITGTVIGKNDTYSYVVNGNDVLFVSDLTLEVDSTYDLVGVFDNTGSINSGTVLKKTKVNRQSVQAQEVSLIGFESNQDAYLYKYISLKGIVVLREEKYVLALEDDFAIELDSSFESAYKNQAAVSVNVISYGSKYVIIKSTSTELSDKEKVYAQALVYIFEDIKDNLIMETTIPYETSISYVSSSNPSVVDVITRKVTPSKLQDVVVNLTIRFSIGGVYCEKTVTVKVLKEEVTELKIYSIEMHQQYGDSTLISYGDYEILIDAGDKKDGPYVNQFLKEHISSDNHLDMIIVTHCHSDHMGGLAYASGESSSSVKALDGIDTIGTIIDYGHDRSTNALHNSWVSIRQKYIDKGAEYYPVYNAAKNLNGAKSHHQIDSKLSLDFLDTQTYLLPGQDVADTKKINTYSVATLLTYENFKFFFAGDLEDEGEYNLLNNMSNTPLKDITEDNIVLYKAAHHGTDPGSNNGGKNGGNQLPFLKALKPDYFFISAAMCSGDYPYPSGTSSSAKIKFIGGQPHPYIKCLANFLKFNDNVYFNGTNGTLEFTTDGTLLKSVHGYGATVSYLLEANGNYINYASQADLKLIDTLWYKKTRKEAVDKYL